jgi:uncharacterized oxidoreductase
VTIGVRAGEVETQARMEGILENPHSYAEGDGDGVQQAVRVLGVRSPVTFAHAVGTARRRKMRTEVSALLIPRLRKQRYAAIVNIPSGLGFTPLAAVPVYCPTKAALHSLSLSLRHQLLGTRVRVLEVAPPMVATELGDRRQRPEEDGYTMTAEAVAQKILTALASDKYEVALGATANLYKQRDKLFEAMNG